MEHPQSAPQATPPRRSYDLAALQSWLAAPITVTLPGWALAGGGLGVLLLALIALD